jgi:hypothetical protein
MKNWILLTLSLIFAHQSFAMENANGMTVLYKGRFEDTRIASFLWERIEKNVGTVDVEKAKVETFIIDPNNKIYIYGSFINPQELEAALSKVDLSKKSISLMLKSGDLKYDELLKKYSLDVTFFDATEMSYLRRTWNLRNSEKPTDGLDLLDQAYAAKTPTKESLSVREYYVTEGGISDDKRREVFWIIIDAPEKDLDVIIKRGEAYLAKMESLDRATMANAEILTINGARVACVNTIFGWDRLAKKMLGNDLDGNGPINMIIFNKYLGRGKGYQYGLRSNRSDIDVGEIARILGKELGGSGWQNGSYSEGGFDSRMEMPKLLDHFEAKGFYGAPSK